MCIRDSLLTPVSMQIHVQAHSWQSTRLQTWSMITAKCMCCKYARCMLSTCWFLCPVVLNMIRWISVTVSHRQLRYMEILENRAIDNITISTQHLFSRSLHANAQKDSPIHSMLEKIAIDWSCPWPKWQYPRYIVQFTGILWERSTLTWQHVVCFCSVYLVILSRF